MGVRIGWCDRPGIKNHPEGNAMGVLSEFTHSYEFPWQGDLPKIILVGRHAERAVIIPEQFNRVSRLHLIVTVSGPKGSEIVVVMDPGSSNDTFMVVEGSSGLELGSKINPQEQFAWDFLKGPLRLSLAGDIEVCISRVDSGEVGQGETVVRE